MRISIHPRTNTVHFLNNVKKFPRSLLPRTFFAYISHQDTSLEQQSSFVQFLCRFTIDSPTRVNSFSTRLLSSCTDEYAHTCNISTYWVNSDCAPCLKHAVMPGQYNWQRRRDSRLLKTSGQQRHCTKSDRRPVSIYHGTCQASFDTNSPSVVSMLPWFHTAAASLKSKTNSLYINISLSVKRGLTYALIIAHWTTDWLSKVSLLSQLSRHM